MHLFPRKAKATPGAFYFGEFDDVPLAPFSISLATITKADYVSEKKHYHTKHQKVYVTLAGSGVLNVAGEDVVMQAEEMIQVEPNELHFVKSVATDALSFIVILGAKENDKVVID